MSDDFYSILQDGPTTVVEFRLRPEMDVLLFDKLMEPISQELSRAGGGTWVLDLSQVSYLNSAGLGLLVNIRQKVRQGSGRLALCGLSPRLMELFRSCCLERLFVIAKTRRDAVAALAR